mgnify:CR=1 FL=1
MIQILVVEDDQKLNPVGPPWVLNSFLKFPCEGES